MPPASAPLKPECADCPQLAELRQIVATLQQRVEELEQQAHRSAAPFRRPPEQRAREKRPPGNKPGHAPAFRPEPPTVEECVEVPLAHCPHCHGPVTNLRPVRQVIEDLPVVIRRCLRLTTYRGHCPHCGEVRSTPPSKSPPPPARPGCTWGRAPWPWSRC